MNKKHVILIAGCIGLYLYSRQSQGAINLTPYTNEISQDFNNWTDSIMGNMTCGERNNNPGNIRPGSNWQGMTGTAECGSSGTFVVFSDPVYGIRAIGKDLLTKYSRGLNTVAKIITVYAPPSENLTGAYISSVSRAIGVGPDTPLNLHDPYTLGGFVKAIIAHENGRVIYDDSLISNGIGLALS